MPVTASSMSERICGSSNGSMAVEFSGQTTKSGSGVRPAATSAASRAVSSACWLGDLPVVRQHVGAVARHVALDGGDVDLRGRGRPSYGAAPGHDGDQRDAGQRHQRPSLARPRAAYADASSAPSSARSEAHAGRADVRQRAGHGGVDDGVRQPAPRHAAGRPVGADVLHRDPGRRQPDGGRREAPQRDRGHAPAAPYQTAWVAESPSQGTVPTACIHHSSVNWKAAPKARPGTHAERAGSPAVTTKKVATANGISQNAWVGGNESASASPATKAARQRVGMGIN